MEEKDSIKRNSKSKKRKHCKGKKLQTGNIVKIQLRTNLLKSLKNYKNFQTFQNQFLINSFDEFAL